MIKILASDATLRPVNMLDPYTTFREEMEKAVQGALHKTVEELNELERFAIAFSVGVPIHSSSDNDHKMKFTTDPCSIFKIGDRFHVAIGKPNSLPKQQYRPTWGANPNTGSCHVGE